MNQSANLTSLPNGQLEELYLEAKKQVSLDRFHYLQQGCVALNREEEEFLVLHKEMRQRGLISANLTLPPLREFDPIHDVLDKLQKRITYWS